MSHGFTQTVLSRRPCRTSCSSKITRPAIIASCSLLLICLNCNWSQRGGMNGIFTSSVAKMEISNTSEDGQYIPIWKKSSPQGSRTAMVRRPCGYCAMTARYYGYREISVREPCNSCAMIVRISYILPFLYDAFLLPCWKKIVRSLHDQRKASARWPCADRTMAPTMCLRATILRFWKICITPR